MPKPRGVKHFDSTTIFSNSDKVALRARERNLCDCLLTTLHTRQTAELLVSNI
tara:strand:- start:231 stop:389 length:159 start_codon:yes stop_codon:yes gene_type:complete